MTMKSKQTKIMLVDDHQFIIDGIKTRLESIANFKIVAEAENGKEAVEKLKEVNPDIIIMDVEMPVMNGFEATQKILSQYPEIKIIALSTYDEKSIVQKMLSAGARGFILKNIKIEELVTALETVMNGQQYFSGEIRFVLAKHTAEEVLNTPSQFSNPLSDREAEVLKLIVQGLSNTQIASKLYISAKTVNTHRTSLMKKLEVHNVAGLISIAIRLKLV